MKLSCPVIVSAALALAGCSGGESDGADYEMADAEAGAAFRFAARDAYGGLNPVCPYTQDSALRARYEPLQARFDALRDQVGSTAFALDLAAVEADYDYYWNRNTVECGPVDTPETPEALDQELRKIADALSSMERAVGGT